MNDSKAYAASLAASDLDHAARRHETIAELAFGVDGRAKFEAIAAKNPGMTAAAAAGAQFLQ
jgi:hypothetical protein